MASRTDIVRRRGRRPSTYLTCVAWHSIIRADARQRAASRTCIPIGKPNMHFSLAQGHPTGTTIRRYMPVVVTMLTLACTQPAWAQKVTTVEGLTFEQTLVQLSNALGA